MSLQAAQPCLKGGSVYRQLRPAVVVLTCVGVNLFSQVVHNHRLKVFPTCERMHGPEFLNDEELLRRSIIRESAATAIGPYVELQMEHRQEVADHKTTKWMLNVFSVIAFVLLVGSILLWWFVLR